jgi:nitrate reductase beta subunit
VLKAYREAYKNAKNDEATEIPRKTAHSADDDTGTERCEKQPAQTREKMRADLLAQIFRRTQPPAQLVNYYEPFHYIARV